MCSTGRPTGLGDERASVDPRLVEPDLGARTAEHDRRLATLLAASIIHTPRSGTGFSMDGLRQRHKIRELVLDLIQVTDVAAQRAS